jgi:hypothetical protein
MKNNERKALKRKQRNQELLDRKKDEDLYILSRLDKNTWEGQTTLPINDIYKKDENESWSIYNYIRW